MTEEQTKIIKAAMSIIGGIKSPAKAAASRANGAKGGRPSRGIGDRREIYRALLRKVGDLRTMTPAERAEAKAKAKADTERIVNRRQRESMGE